MSEYSPPVTLIVRAARVAASALLSLAFVLPLLAVFSRDGVETTTKLIVAAVVLLAASVPAYGLMAVTALLPLALGLEILSGGALRAAALTEILMFAFVAGAVLRTGVSSAGMRSRLFRPALTLGAIIATSVIVELASQQAANQARPVALELWRHVAGEYFVREQPFGAFHEAMRWIGGLALCVVVERILRRAPEISAGLFRIWLISGAAAATFAILRVGQILLEGRRGPPLEALLYVVRELRITALHADPNAAGSYFILFLAAGVLAGLVGRRYWVLGTAVPVIGFSFLAARSRAAVGALLFALGATWIAGARRNRKAWLGAAGALSVGAALVAFWMFTSRTHATPEDALSIRADLNRVSMRMARDHPIFGVGLSHYREKSAQYVTPDLAALSRWFPAGENAHNNFFQILGELGLAGLAAFVWLVVPVSLPWRPDIAAPWPTEARALAAGLGAFLISAIFGHPLLITQVLVAFFLTVGMAAGMAPPPSGSGRAGRVLIMAGIAVIVLLLPWRISQTYAEERDFEGLGAVEGDLDGVSFRKAESGVRWRVSAWAQSATVPLRWSEQAADDCQVTLVFDGRIADRVRPSRERWLPVRFGFARAAPGSPRRLLEAQISDARCQLLVGPITFQ